MTEADPVTAIHIVSTAHRAPGIGTFRLTPRLPRAAGPGEVIEVRALLSHPMVNGASGLRPRDMLARFEVTQNGLPLIACDFGNGSAADPVVIFHARAEAPGAFVFTRTHEDGRVFTLEQAVAVG